MCFPSFSPFCHDPVEILYVSGVYQVFLSVWDFLCVNAFVCYCSDTGVILECPRLEVAWELYKPVSTFSVEQFLFLPPIHSPLPAALSIHFRYLSHSARSSTSKTLLNLISSGMIRYFLFTKAKLAAAWATLFFVHPVFSVTCLAISKSSKTCFPFWSTTLYRFILFLTVFPYLYRIQIVPAEYLHKFFVTVLLFK